MIVGSHISAGFADPAAWRSVITVDGISWKPALLITSIIARQRIPISPCFMSSEAALTPAGVAAFPIPKRFADMFMHSADQHSSSSRPGNKPFAHRRNIRPIRATSPVCDRISIRPLHSIMDAASVITTAMALLPQFSSAPVTCPVFPVRAAHIKDAIIIITQTTLITHPPYNTANRVLCDKIDSHSTYILLSSSIFVLKYKICLDIATVKV